MLSNGGTIYRRKITPEMLELTDVEENMQEDMRKDICGRLVLKKSYFPLITAMSTSDPDYYKICNLTGKTCVGEYPSLGERFEDTFIDMFREIVPKGKESPLAYGLSKKIVERCPSREFK